MSDEAAEVLVADIAEGRGETGAVERNEVRGVGDDIPGLNAEAVLREKIHVATAEPAVVVLDGVAEAVQVLPFFESEVPEGADALVSVPAMVAVIHDVTEDAAGADNPRHTRDVFLQLLGGVVLERAAGEHAGDDASPLGTFGGGMIAGVGHSDGIERRQSLPPCSGVEDACDAAGRGMREGRQFRALLLGDAARHLAVAVGEAAVPVREKARAVGCDGYRQAGRDRGAAVEAPHRLVAGGGAEGLLEEGDAGGEDAKPFGCHAGHGAEELIREPAIEPGAAGCGEG